METVTVLSCQQFFGNNAILHHIGRAPFTSDGYVIPKVPGKVITKFLFPAIYLPLPERIKV